MTTTIRASSRSAEYARAHRVLRQVRGPASRYVCAVCDRRAAEWAYIGLRGGLLPYGEPGDYAPMCRSHHRRMDAGSRRARKRAGTGQDFLF